MDRQARKLANRHNQGDRWVGCFTLLRCWGLFSAGCVFHETEATAELKSQLVRVLTVRTSLLYRWLLSVNERHPGDVTQWYSTSICEAWIPFPALHTQIH